MTLHDHAPAAVLDPASHTLLAPGHRLRACVPVGEGEGAAFVATALCAPLASAMPEMEVRTDLALAGTFEGREWTAASGHLFGGFRAPLFGIAPTGRVAHIRFGCFQHWQDDEIAETLLLLDLPALMIQAGAWPMGPPIGPLLMAPAPGSGDGLGPHDPGRSRESLSLVEAMIGGLMRYDGSGRLATMGMAGFWTSNFSWYGPGPIGTFQGHRDYERGHQRPFLAAFPDRVGGNHRARFAAGRYVASTGWPSITATHAGGDWLGLAPTGRPVTMRVMDFWRVAETDGSPRLAENWVMIDIPDLLSQLGVDVFARAAVLTDRSSTDG